MKTNKKFIRYFLPYSAIVCAILYTYWALPQTYFQQDEWIGLGHRMYDLSLPKFGFPSQFYSGGLFSQFGPLGAVPSFIQVALFRLHFAPYAYLSIFFHIISSLLVYFFVTRLTKERMVGLLTGLFFATWYNSHQAVTWMATYLAIQEATLFLLLSLIFFLKYQDEKNRRKYYYLSLGMLLISLGFKEIAAPCFIFFPIWGLINIKKEQRWRFSWLKEQIPLAICAFLYLGVRALFSLIKVEQYSMTVWDQSWNYFPITIYNLVTMPLTNISQIFIPDATIRNLIHRLPQAFLKSTFFSGPHTIYTIHITFISLLLSFLIIALVIKLILFLRRQGERKRANIILLASIWIGVAALPFAFLGRPLGFLDGRYYYLSAIGAALLLSMVIFCIADKVRQRLVSFKIRDAVYYGLIGLLVIPILFFHSAKIRQHIEGRIKVGDEQKAILSEIKKAYPKIGRKSIFYVEPLMYPTFYSGFGHTLMVVYAYEGQLNPGFFKGDFLWGIRWQGYREIEGNGFGYFWQFSELVKAIKEFRLSPENVYAFRYNAQAKKLKNITNELRNRIKYSGMTAYISKPQPDKRLYLGFPDGQRRSFSSEEFVPTEIKEVINLTDNEEWFPCDFIAWETRKAAPDPKDYFITYNYGLESCYGGTSLVYHLQGNGTNVYSIPDKVYGHKVAGFSCISSPIKGSSIMKRIVQKKGGGFEVTLLSSHPPSDTIEFILPLNAKAIYYKPGEEVNDIAAGQYAEARGDGKSKKFIIPLSGVLKSLRSYWESNELRYQPKAFVNGVMTQISSWSGIDTPFLTIEFEKPPAEGAVIEVPILVTYAPKPDDVIRIVNF